MARNPNGRVFGDVFLDKLGGETLASVPEAGAFFVAGGVPIWFEATRQYLNGIKFLSELIDVLFNQFHPLWISHARLLCGIGPFSMRIASGVHAA